MIEKQSKNGAAIINGPAIVAYIWLQQKNGCQLVQFSLLSLSNS